MKAPVARDEIARTLAARGLSPLHRFGQNFLVRKDVLDRMVELAGVEEGEVVLEVGPGCGGLTERLLERGARVVAVEIDRGLAGIVRDVLGGRSGLELLNRDVLARKSAIAPEVLAAVDRFLRDSGGSRWKVVANLPYQISSPFLAGITVLDRPPDLLLVTVQREVGDVLLATPGSGDWSPLSFLARLYYRCRRELVLGPESFFPRPKVASSVMRLERKGPPGLPPAELLPFARRLLQNRRKTLAATLPAALEHVGLSRPDRRQAEDLLRAAGISPETRIESVEPERVEDLLHRARSSGP